VILIDLNFIRADFRPYYESTSVNNSDNNRGDHQARTLVLDIVRDIEIANGVRSCEARQHGAIENSL